MQHFLYRPAQAWKWTAIALIVTLATSCTPTSSTSGEAASSTQEDRPDVVASSSVVCDLVQQLAQDTIQLTCLIDPGQDPHTYEPTPSDRRAIDDADLILYEGYNYAPDIIRLVTSTTNSAPKVAVYEEAVPKPLMGQGHDHEHEADEPGHAEAEDEHGHETDTANAGDVETPDPHVWHDAENGVAIVKVLEENLAAIAPTHAAQYEANAAKLTEQLSGIHTWIKAQVSTVPPANRKLVTPHDAFHYFAAAYGFSVGGTLSGLSTSEEVAAGNLTDLVDEVKSAGVPAIFAEATTNPKSIEAIARNAGVTVAPQPLYVEGPTGPNTAVDHYQTMLVTNTCTIVNALGGTCKPEDAPAVP
ncbi:MULTISPECIES: zinc ABC transporter substrate-binding protein [unclassified Leptolyngbya]|uniref:metal ABC transporter solute-binding protein, Zn/Mn family n=1 Tax=unclassified Leptolyngbya TaxID=2650499 RepID=UPI0016843EBB|nr:MULTISPECIES: zinc ABC transporter substrate-binding protein [unclassified Leptolyngbya]MBD1913782.1 zinc ABC transporter substrate-binding protein [Leptolyngbya sp. FACHB-8]MBD2156134.1 zinc ABC transporter substrate-binding protein [Leptolyngbya sp. FACHB-16]